MHASIHFISGLPRSGSTLLSALLRQNPRFHAGMTGPVGSLVEAMLRNMSMGNETSIFITDAQREALLRAVFTTFYSHAPAGNVVFDTNRMWCTKLPLIAELFPQARVICCVRDMPWVFDSIERLIRTNKFQPSGIFNFEPGGTVYSRVDGLAAPGGPAHQVFHFGPGDRNQIQARAAQAGLFLLYRALMGLPIPEEGQDRATLPGRPGTA